MCMTDYIEIKSTTQGTLNSISPPHAACSQLRPGGKVGRRLLPYNRRVALADGDVVGGPLHIHTPDGESCGDKTEQSEKRSLQLPPTRLAPNMHLNARLGSNRSTRAKKPRRVVRTCVVNKRGMDVGPKRSWMDESLK